MRCLPVVLVSLLISTAHAVVPRPPGPRVAADVLTAMPAASSKPLRTHAEYRHGPTRGQPWLAFAAATGAAWDVSWDAATGVPSRIWGSGLPIPGSSASPVIAERAARQLLADHIALLAPGATPGDFELVANHDDGDIRSIGFVQRAGGRLVVGGQVSFRFKRDRLFVIGSEALPNVTVAPSAARLAKVTLALRARATTRAELALPHAPVTEPGDEVIVPFVGDLAVLGYRVAAPVTIDGGADGRYRAYVDPASGALLAVRQLNTYATATIAYRGVDRYPAHPRIDRAAPRVHVMIDGVEQSTSATGRVSWSPDTTKTVTLSVKGDLVTVVNKATATGTTVSTTMTIAPDGQIVWDASATPEDDAQLVTYLATNQVKEFVRANIDASLSALDEPMIANTNIAQDCNAFFDGKAINFFHATATCENTGRIEDVVFHEFGHNLHVREIIPGVGEFDGAMSEGVADFLAASMTGDPGMGRGFFFTDSALRQLDPEGSEHIFPRDVGEIHYTGMIYGGTFWDLRKTLIEQLGESAGAALTLKIYLGTLRRATDIPSSLIEALATDDDDGNLANGTPHECAIRDAFGRHGMRTANGSIDAPATLDEHALATTVRIGVTGLSHCTGDAIVQATLGWRPAFKGPVRGSVEAVRTDPARFYAQLPLALDDSVFYQSKIRFGDDTELRLPDNIGDPEYQIYQGHTVALYCTNFDEDPFQHGWTQGTSHLGDPAWSWGQPTGEGTSPPGAFTGTKVLLEGGYSENATSFIKSPVIDVRNYSDVRLQYRRWLAVEDSEFDQAQVTANGKRAWINRSAHAGGSSALHHIDREWRFHDVPLSGFFSGRTVQVGFDLTSDANLGLGGWAIDDLCVVANTKSVCGDGIKAPTEICDDGIANADAPDKCRTFCRAPICGDGIADSDEECDEGPNGTATCSVKCEAQSPAVDGGCGCTSGGDAAGSLGFGAVVAGVLRRRRRTVPKRCANAPITTTT